jgi:hypothetical protein
MMQWHAADVRVRARAGGTFRQFVATILIKFLIVIPYFAFRSLGDIDGGGDKTLVRLFSEPRHSG